VTWYAATDPEGFAPERFPVWIWLDQPSFYGFPTWRGPGPKVGEDVGGGPTTPGTRTFDPDIECLDRAVAFLERHMPGAVGGAVKTKTCLYTVTPDRDFVVDRLPEHPGVVVALGAAHAYKFAALFGRWLAELATSDKQRHPDPRLGLFAIDRSAMLRGGPTNLVGSA
jgi:sarcosine oxidase